MSHTITLKGVRFTDTQMLGNIVRDLSKGTAEFIANAETYRTESGLSNKCDAMIKMPGRYDIGFSREKDKQGVSALTPHMSYYMQSNVLNNMFIAGGNPVGKISQEYALREAEYQAAQQGMTTRREEQRDGTVTLVMVGAD